MADRRRIRPIARLAVMAQVCLVWGIAASRAEPAQSLWQRLAPPVNQAKPGPWAVHFYYGHLVDTYMTQIHYAPWTTRWTSASIFGINVHRRIVTLWKYLDLEVEVGGARRFQEQAWEVHAALTVRWDGFVWNDHVYTTIAISPFGPSYTDKITYWENEYVDFKEKTGRLANVFSTELTLALPQYRDYPLIFRVHHRSQIFGLNGGNKNAASFVTIGFRIHF